MLVFMAAFYGNYEEFKFMRLRSLAAKTIIVKQIFTLRKFGAEKHSRGDCKIGHSIRHRTVQIIVGFPSSHDAISETPKGIPRISLTNLFPKLQDRFNPRRSFYLLLLRNFFSFEGDPI